MTKSLLEKINVGYTKTISAQEVHMEHTSSTDTTIIKTEADRILQINWDNVCSGCMRELNDSEITKHECPYCNFNRELEVRGYSLPDKTILNGKYIVGRLLALDEDKITYLGYDLNLQTLLQIEEYYPSSLVTREENSSTIKLKDEMNEESFKSLKNNYIEESKKTIKNNTETGIPVSIRELFEENNTIYKVLKPIYDDSQSEILQGFINTSPLTTKKKSKKGLLIGISVAFIIFTILFAIILINNKDSKKNNDSSKEHTSSDASSTDYTYYNSSYILGAHYQKDNIAILSIDDSIYFSEIDSSGNWGQLYPLLTLDNQVFVAFISCDNESIYYTDGNGSGVYKLPIASDIIEPKLISSNNAWGLTVTGEYVYYSDITSLYRIKKDGTNEIVISDSASDYFTVNEKYIYYYSEEDGLLYQCDLDGSNTKFILDIGEVTDLIVLNEYLYINQNGKIYKYNIETQSLDSNEPISSATQYTEFFVINDELYFINETDTALNKYNPKDKTIHIVFDDAPCYLAAPLGDYIVILTDSGDYYCINATDSSVKILDFNYLDLTTAK